MLLEAIRKTKEKVDFILVDWKGLGTAKHDIIQLIESMGLAYERSDKILKNS